MEPQVPGGTEPQGPTFQVKALDADALGRNHCAASSQSNMTTAKIIIIIIILLLLLLLLIIIIIIISRSNNQEQGYGSKLKAWRATASGHVR